MQKTICTILTILILFPFFTISVSAENDDMAFTFELTVDGKETKEVKTGDIITVVLKLHRTDSSDPYTMYAMQDEIQYDSTFFELVENSAVLNTGIVTTDIATADRYREFYMNYLSMSGGAQWDPDMLIGSIQLKVVGESGVTQITNQDYLVSLQDGSDSYLCDASDVTIILTTDCAVTFMSNGGTRIPDQIVQYGEKISRPENPVREGCSFDGWYKDIHLTDEWDFDDDVVQSNMSLYAKWTISHCANTAPNSDPKPSFRLWWLILLLIVLLLLVYYRQKKPK